MAREYIIVKCSKCSKTAVEWTGGTNNYCADHSPAIKAAQAQAARERRKAEKQRKAEEKTAKRRK